MACVMGLLVSVYWFMQFAECHAGKACHAISIWSGSSPCTMAGQVPSVQAAINASMGSRRPARTCRARSRSSPASSSACNMGACEDGSMEGRSVHLDTALCAASRCSFLQHRLSLPACHQIATHPPWRGRWKSAPPAAPSPGPGVPASKGQVGGPHAHGRQRNGQNA